MTTVFILIEAWGASAGNHLLRRCLFPEKTNIMIKTLLTPYILQVFIVI